MESLSIPRRRAMAAVRLLTVGLLAFATGIAAPIALAQDGPDGPQPIAPDPFPPTAASDVADEPPDDDVAADDGRMSPLELVRENPGTTIGSVVPFLVASLIAIWFGVERLVVLRNSRVIPRPFVDRFLNLLRLGQLDPGSALTLCEDNDSPVAHVFAHGVRKWGKPSVEVEQAIIDGGERQVALLRKHLRILNSVATVSPLIGLLGTVIGMMMAFFDLAGSDGGNRAQELAVGIVTALSTTALGLAIAIPCLILYTYLAARIDNLVMEMDELAQQVVNYISAEGLSTNPPVRPHPRSRTKQPDVI